MPRLIPFYVCDSFTDTPFAGNPAGVFLDDAGTLTEAQMKALAGEVHLESAFVAPVAPDDRGIVDFVLRFFTGVREVPLCGHATVAALTALVHAGRVPAGQTVQAATNAGKLPVSVSLDGTITLSQHAPQFDDLLRRVAERDARIVADIDSAEVAFALGLATGDLAADLPVAWVTTGTPWLLVPTASRAVVDRTPTDFAGISALSEKHAAFGLYVFAREGGGGEPVRIWSRCYAPVAGLNEDPVTGSASGALGGYLAHHGALVVPPGGSATFTTQQGFAGGRGGGASVTVTRDAGRSLGRVAVSGRAVIVAEGAFTVG